MGRGHETVPGIGGTKAFTAQFADGIIFAILISMLSIFYCKYLKLLVFNGFSTLAE